MSHCYLIATAWNNTSISHHFRALGADLARRGHQVVFLVPDQKYHLVNSEANPAIYTWPSPRPTKLRDALFLRRLIQQYKPSCVIANFGASNLMLAVGWLLQVPHRIDWYHTLTKQIPDSSGGRLKSVFQRLRKRFVYWLATNLVANSQASNVDLQQGFHPAPGKSRVFYYSIQDPLAFAELSGSVPLNNFNEKIQFQLLCVGRLEPDKGQATLIRAVAQLKEIIPGLFLTFLGDGSARDEYRALATRLGVASICNFEGAVPPEEVLPRMQSAWITIVPSHNEAFGMVALESIAVGTPVIASNVGGLAEIIRDGVDGFLVAPNEPTILANRIRQVCNGANLRQTMAQNARQRFLETFEQKRVVGQISDWLEQLEPLP